MRVAPTPCALLAGMCVAVSALTPAEALVLHPADDPAVGLARPADAVVGRWASNASVVAVSSQHVITTKHQGGGVGTTVSIAGDTLIVAEITNHATADLRVARLETLGGGTPVLTDFVAVYDQTDEAGQVAVLGGFGEGRGADIVQLGTTVGYQWAGAGSRSLRWGANTIDAAGTAAGNDILIADFDGPGVGVFAESTLADGDSGGGYFLYDDGQWKVAALHRAVQNTDEARFLAAPESLDGVRLSSYSTFINTTVPEPSSALLFAGLVAGAMARRRRS